jgi:uroporphyrinogen-III synthase
MRRQDRFAQARGPCASLAGACVIVTRSGDAGAAVDRMIVERGGTPVRLPGLSLRAVQDPQAAATSLRAASGAQEWIFTSPVAVRFSFSLVPELRIPDGVRVFCMGAGTQRALARYAIRAIAPVERTDSEGLLALPELTDVRSRNVALVGAPGGRDLLAETLRGRGAVVDAIHVYERRPPRLTKRHFDRLARAPEPWITLISSGEALANIVRLVPAVLLARLRHQVLVASSARVETLAHELGFEDVLTACSAAPHDLLDAAGRALARHRL